MYGVVPAAGRGSRLRPKTDETPKGLLEVGNQPLLTSVFETLAPHVTEYVVVVGYRGDDIRDYYGESFGETPITYVTQQEPNGLADAVFQTEYCIDGPFLQLNGDNVLRGNVDDVVETHRRPGVDATLLVDSVSADRAKRGGVVELDDGEVSAVVEKPAESPSRLATTGCFAFSPRIFEACATIEPSERGEYELADAIEWLLENGGTVETVRLDGWRVNVNTPDDIERAELRS